MPEHMNMNTWHRTRGTVAHGTARQVSGSGVGGVLAVAARGGGLGRTHCFCLL